jgi:hypothetical protein
MAEPSKLYINGIRKKLQYYYAAWLPSVKFTLGDIGVLENKTFFNNKTKLTDIGINFKIKNDKDPAPINIQSEKGVEIVSKIAGEVNAKAPNIPQGKAGIAINFSAKGAFVVKAPETYQPSIENVLSLEKQILDLWEKDVWKEDWVVIARLVTAPSASIFISKSSGQSIELTADAQVIPGTSVQFLDPSVKFNISFTSGDMFEMNDAKNVTPFFQLVGLKTIAFRKPKANLKYKMEPEQSEMNDKNSYWDKVTNLEWIEEPLDDVEN